MNTNNFRPGPPSKNVFIAGLRDWSATLRKGKKKKT